MEQGVGGAQCVVHCDDGLLQLPHVGARLGPEQLLSNGRRKRGETLLEDLVFYPGAQDLAGLARLPQHGVQPLAGLLLSTFGMQQLPAVNASAGRSLEADNGRRREGGDRGGVGLLTCCR